MPRTRKTTVYTFDELGDRAKDQARTWMREREAEEFDADHVLEDAATICGLLGVRLKTRTVRLGNGDIQREPVIMYRGFSAQGDGACFEGSYSYAAGSVAKIREHAPNDTELHEIADSLRVAQRRHFYQLQASLTHRGHYTHEHSIEIEVEDARDAYRDIGEDSDAIAEALRDLMRWIYRQLEREYEYRTADAQIDETIRANEYEFDESGHRA